MADICLDGLGVALITPFQKDLSIDFKALESLIEHVVGGGVDYVVVLGTTAETPTLTKEEKVTLISFVREKINGRVPLILGIGGNNTMAVVDDILTADLRGYEAILSVTPYYNKPSQEGLFQHYKVISEASPLPILLYNVPGRTGTNLTSRTTLRLANLSKKICGVKEASGNMEQAYEIIKEAPKGFSLVSGDDASIYCLMKKGAKGVVSVLANAFPKEVKKLVDLCDSQSFEEAELYQAKLDTIIKHLFTDGNPAGVKSLLSEMGMIHNILRLPLVPASREVSDQLSKARGNLLSL